MLQESQVASYWFPFPFETGSHQMDYKRKKLAETMRVKAHFFKAWSRAWLSHNPRSYLPGFIVPKRAEFQVCLLANLVWWWWGIISRRNNSIVHESWQSECLHPFYAPNPLPLYKSKNPTSCYYDDLIACPRRLRLFPHPISTNLKTGFLCLSLKALGTVSQRVVWKMSLGRR